MRGTPGTHALDMHRTLEVIDVVGFAQPRRLAGRLARLLANTRRAIPLTTYVAAVGEEELSATQALALSALRHRRTPIWPDMTITLRAARLDQTIEEDGEQPRRRGVKDAVWKKTDPEEEARSDRRFQRIFGPAVTACGD
jgi:hypothetical protein